MKKIILAYSAMLALMLAPERAFASDDPILSIGIQERARGDFVANQNLDDLSFDPGTHDAQVLSRTRPSITLKPVKEVTGFVQGQYYIRKGHFEYSELSIYRAYLELSGLNKVPLSLKVGRQELSYGSTFFLGPNDFYNGLVWDGAKLRITPSDNFWIDLIGAWYVQLDKNISKDEPGLYGGYSSYELARDINLDIYFFYHKGGFKFFHSDLPDDSRWYTIGTRLAGKIGERFDFEIEPLYQFGNIDNPDRGAHDIIAAYGGHMEAGCTFDTQFNPRLFAGYAFGSGDNDSSDKFYHEFHGNIYNDQYIVGDMSVIADLSGITVGDSRASGMSVFIGGVSMDLHPKLGLNVDYHYFLADKTPDDISKDLGGEINIILTYKLLKNLTVMASANRFFTGNFFEDTASSRKDIDYVFVQGQIEF